MSFSLMSIKRLWQPQRGLFWLMLAFNLLSSGLAWFVHLTQPADGLRLVLGLLALINAGIGWWLAVRLWREAHTRSPVPQKP